MPLRELAVSPVLMSKSRPSGRVLARSLTLPSVGVSRSGYQVSGYPVMMVPSPHGSLTINDEDADHGPERPMTSNPDSVAQRMRDAGLPAETLGVLGGVPFAAAPTAHQVSVHGGPMVSANCAVDAPGIGAMLGRDSDVRSVDPTSGEPVTAAERGGQWTWHPVNAVVFVGSSGDGTITDACCPVINFVANTDSALAYKRRHGLSGEVLSLPEAAQAGALVFSDLLAEPTP